MSTVELKNGGDVERLSGKLVSIGVAAPDDPQSESIQMRIKSNDSDRSTRLPDESLSYLSIDEATELIGALKSAIKETVDQYEHS